MKRMLRLAVASAMLATVFLSIASVAYGSSEPSPVLEKAAPNSGCPNAAVVLSGQHFGRAGMRWAWFVGGVTPFATPVEAKITSETSATTRVPIFLALPGANESGQVSLETTSGRRSNAIPFTLTSLVSCSQGREGKEGPVGKEGKEGKPGAPGAAGKEGPEGKSGPEGKEGPAGPPGQQGIPGKEGAEGKEGKEGPAGATGPTGPEGPGVKTVSGIVYENGSASGRWFTASNPKTGEYIVTFATGEFEEPPAMVVTGFGIDGALPVFVVSEAKKVGGSWVYDVLVSSTVGTNTPSENAFMFVASEV